MTKTFLNSKEVEVNKGYLSVVNESNKMTPVSNAAFIEAQKQAEWVVTFAKLAKGKDFKGKTADSLESLKSEVSKELAAKATKYVDVPKVEKGKITIQLADEALAFIKGAEDKTKAEKVNNFLQQFNILQEFEEVGLFFEQEIVKIEKIYTVTEIVEAVNSVIDLLD